MAGERSDVNESLAQLPHWQKFGEAALAAGDTRSLSELYAASEIPSSLNAVDMAAYALRTAEVAASRDASCHQADSIYLPPHLEDAKANLGDWAGLGERELAAQVGLAAANFLENLAIALGNTR